MKVAHSIVPLSKNADRRQGFIGRRSLGADEKRFSIHVGLVLSAAAHQPPHALVGTCDILLSALFR